MPALVKLSVCYSSIPIHNYAEAFHCEITTRDRAEPYLSQDCAVIFKNALYIFTSAKPFIWNNGFALERLNCPALVDWICWIDCPLRCTK